MLNNGLVNVRQRLARLLESPRPTTKPEADWTIQEFHARTALERLCAIAQDSQPEVRKPVRSALSNLKRAAAIKGAR
jgi:hypothetical protein